METTQKINISQAPWLECECGSMQFTSIVMVKRVSALMSPDAKEHIIPIEVHICNICKKVPGFVSVEVPGLPDEMKAIKNK